LNSLRESHALMSNSENNPWNLQKALGTHTRDLNFRKHLEFISENSHFVFVPSFSQFLGQVLEIIPEILKKKAPQTSKKEPNFRKHLKFISETSYFVFVPSFSQFWGQVLEIIPGILKKPRKLPKESPILGSTLNSSQKPHILYSYQVSNNSDVRFWK